MVSFQIDRIRNGIGSRRELGLSYTPPTPTRLNSTVESRRRLGDVLGLILQKRLRCDGIIYQVGANLLLDEIILKIAQWGLCDAFITVDFYGQPV